MPDTPWPAATATGIGSMPGTDPAEAARTVLGELPHLPHLPELPARGLGADIIGRTAAMLVDLPIEEVPSGYRVAAHAGMDHRRATDLLARDLDVFGEVLDSARPQLAKIQIAGPWTLTAGIELARGHRVLTDQGALREFTESLAEGLARHVADVVARTGASVLVQIDEPTLPMVLAGRLPTPSGFGTVPAVAESAARDVLATVIDAAKQATNQPVAVHCCADRPPIALCHDAGADLISLDATLITASDELGEVWDAGVTMMLGLVPSTDPAQPTTLADVAKPALRLVDRLGFPRSILAERAIPTPTCGLAGASTTWARHALALAAELGMAFVEPPESWTR
ncbi:MAG TPA: methionine synthase [Pseudonocardiaceae bacterium]|nr:methionine synthase [Pseudonocardiaceae bacterium]